MRSDIAVKVFGDDLKVLRVTAEKINRIIRKVPGAEDVKVEQTAGLPQLSIEANRDAIARYGINVEDVNNIVQSIIAGQPAGIVYEGEQRFDMIVRLSERSGHDMESIRSLLVSAPPMAVGNSVALIPLSALAKITVEEGPAQISREDRRRRIVVELNVRGRDIGSFVKDAQAAIEKEIKLPEGYYITWGGQFENLQRATVMLSIVVPLRPVLMTALVASLGFFPMAFSSSAGAEVQRPLATVVIGGLITSSVLTLLLLPNLYIWFENTAQRLEGRNGHKKRKGEKPTTEPMIK